jgi:DNA invertase Pin-like site-specific DNA recombinase
VSNIAIYARVSTRDKGQDVDNQLAQIKQWAAAQGHNVAAVYTDQASGSGKVRRPGFEACLKAAHEGSYETLVFWSLDRLSREGVLETLQYLKRLDNAGVAWRSHTEAYLDSCGVFRDAVLAILAAIAKQERVRISERVKAGLDRAAAQGRKGGRPRAARDEVLVQELRKAGRSVSQIATETGIARSTVGKMVRGLW